MRKLPPPLPGSIPLDDLGPFAIPHSHSHDFIAKSNGQPYRVWVATAGKPDPSNPLPALFVVDANAQFGTLVETARLLIGTIPQIVVVGVGYPDLRSSRDVLTMRAHELTPSHDESHALRTTERGMSLPPNGLGGAPAFLQFITEEAAPFIEERYACDPNDRALFGYSLGGLFTLFALLQEKPAFRRYIAGSPSLWWDNRMLFELERQRAGGPKQLPARVFISAGEQEEQPRQQETAPFRMVSNALEFAGLLGSRAYEGLELDFRIISASGHDAPPMLVDGLKSVYRGHAAATPPK